MSKDDFSLDAEVEATTSILSGAGYVTSQNIKNVKGKSMISIFRIPQMNGSIDDTKYRENS